MTGPSVPEQWRIRANYVFRASMRRIFRPCSRYRSGKSKMMAHLVIVSFTLEFRLCPQVRIICRREVIVLHYTAAVRL